ncbi:RDD family protein [Exilibacterium tricleocarpae]|uniref:RDD family protein n=1 Tax=Exilibacterium tricleocarpae TaxID=2591008 RepID=UPI001FEBF23D|nr:RDD family protein [Exilibacterium tricleocarpae]
MTAPPLDTLYTVETPESVALPLRPASILPRIMAFTVDFLIRALIFFLSYLGLRWTGEMGWGLLLITYFMLEWFYPVYFEVRRDGMTPGKKLLGLRVVHDDGTPVSLGGSLLRNLLRAADFLPVGYAAGVVAATCNREFKRLGDLVAGTLVIYELPAPPAPALNCTGKRPVPADFSTDEQKALLAFAERSDQLSEDRQRELAGVLQPLLNTPDPVLAIRQMANSLVGQR